MKKIGMYFFVLLLSSVVFVLGFQEKNTLVPNYLYQVYLDDEVLGVIKSKSELENYIDNEGASIKEQYNVDKVYAPNGLQIKRIITYSNKVDSVEEVYKKLKDLKSFTIEGYQFTIKSEEEKQIIYTTDKEFFEKAITNTIETYVGKEEYDNYLNGTQEEILTTGIVVDDVYIEEDIAVKNVKIPVTEEIYTNANDLSKYILFDTTEESQKYIVQEGDTIEKIAKQNKIGVEAFLISNSELTSKDNILYKGQEVSLAVPKPAVTVVAEYTQVEDKESEFSIEEKQDPTMNVGDEEIIQNGEKGLDRVTSRIEKTNGEISYVKNTKSVVLKPATNQIVLVGTRYQSNIGGRWWAWPTQSAYYISSGYGGRTHPKTGVYDFHQAIDIYVGMWTQIYAANNGTVIKIGYDNSYGNHMIINHNNGYYTLYAHMASIARGIKVGSTVGRGQLIGYMGMTGVATGPHLHFEVWICPPWSVPSEYGTINPLRLY